MARVFPRVRVPELMDDPQLDPQAHARALAGLRRVNSISRADAILWNPLLKLAQSRPDQPLRILDVATGSGDVPMKLVKRFQRQNISVQMSACDISPTAIAETQQRAATDKILLNCFTCDVLGQPIPGEFDVVVCSLFLHHFDPPEVTTILRRMAEAAKVAVFVNDLRRCSTGWWAAYIGTRILSRSPIVHYDGPVSVTAAYTLTEMEQMANDAGLVGAKASNRWPWRMLLEWHRPS